MRTMFAIFAAVTLLAGAFAALDAGTADARKSGDPMYQRHKEERNEREGRRIAAQLCSSMASSGGYSNMADEALAAYCVNVATFIVHADFEQPVEPPEGDD